MRRPCFPPEARTDTGRLHSTGSRSPSLPRRQRYYAALRLPGPLQPPLRFPLRATCHGSDASSWPHRACIRERAARRRLVFGSPYDCPVYRRGETGVSQVTWPSSSPAPRSTTPPGASPPRPMGATTLLPSGLWKTLGTRDCLFVAIRPAARDARVPTHQRRCCHHRSRARHRPGGLTFGRAGLAPAGRHPNFTESSHAPLSSVQALPGRFLTWAQALQSAVSLSPRVP